jgi:hypothetical protein
MNYWNLEMSFDTINDEIRAARRKLSLQFDNNLSAIIEDLRARQKTDGRTYVTRPPRQIRPQTGEKGDTHKPPVDCGSVD